MNRDRRKFLRLGILGLLSSYIPCTLGRPLFFTEELTDRAHQYRDYFISAYQNDVGEYFAARFNEHGQIIDQQPLPHRGHSFAVNPTNHQIYCFSRRPNNTIEIISRNGEVIERIHADNDRHFYGHGVCSHDGEFLYTTENNITSGQGVIGVYRVNEPSSLTTKTTKVMEFSSGGIGPHDIKLSHDGQRLIVANGGIKTHPETGRQKLNLNDMRPSLVFIYRVTGKIHNRFQLPQPFQANSIRHLTISKSGNVFIALQHQKRTAEHEVLLASYSALHQKIITIVIPQKIKTLLMGYLGDLALDASERYIATTSPRGNRILFYDLQEQRCNEHELADVCGIQACTEPNTFVASNGQGSIVRYVVNGGKGTVNEYKVSYNPSIRWDNHIVKI